MLPEINDEQRSDAATTDGVTSVKGGRDLELTVVVNEPHPAAAKDGLAVLKGDHKRRLNTSEPMGRSVQKSIAEKTYPCHQSGSRTD